MDGRTTRRDVVRGIAIVGMASAVSAPVLGAAVSSEAAPTRLANPQGKYPKPPFQMRSQPWPALQSKMVPVPACGETSYKGSGPLTAYLAMSPGGADSVAIITSSAPVDAPFVMSMQILCFAAVLADRPTAGEACGKTVPVSLNPEERCRNRVSPVGQIVPFLTIDRFFRCL